MKSKIQDIKENYRLIIGVLVFGVILGWVFFYPSGESVKEDQELIEKEEHDHEETTVWTCSMHPQIKQDKPGLCPICAMDLIPLSSMHSQDESLDSAAIVMTETAAKLADIQTIIVERGIPQKSISLQGKIYADERNIAKLTSRFGGRIEKLFVNFTGQEVRKGQPLATIYSPGLVTAQRELLEAMTLKEDRPSLYAAAKGKLRLWDLSDQQISEIEKKGEPQVYFDVLSPISGTITQRNVAKGDYLKEGMTLFEVVDLSKLWVMFDAYEMDLPWIKVGDRVQFTVHALPGENWVAKVQYIDPFINGKTRIAQVRVAVPNSGKKLKPGMFVSGMLKSQITGMADNLLIPKSAVLWTGKRSVVYVKIPDAETPSFLFREVILGPEAGDKYVVMKGLQPGEEIASNGVFKIDAAAQLRGLPSMMNPNGGKVSGGHIHADMSMEPNIEMSKEEHAMVKVAGNCDMCKERIEKAALSVEGVLSASWDANQQMLHFNFDSERTNSEEVQKAIARVGHDTEKYKAEDGVYDGLPGCCHYQRLP